LCNFLHSLVTSSLLGPNIPLSTLFSNALSLCSSLNVRDQVSHPYKTTGRIIALYILTVKFLDSRREDRRLWQPEISPFNYSTQAVKEINNEAELTITIGWWKDWRTGTLLIKETSTVLSNTMPYWHNIPRSTRESVPRPPRHRLLGKHSKMRLLRCGFMQVPNTRCAAALVPNRNFKTALKFRSNVKYVTAVYIN
jgi:hypothetical protein